MLSGAKSINTMLSAANFVTAVEQDALEDDGHVPKDMDSRFRAMLARLGIRDSDRASREGIIGQLISIGKHQIHDVTVDDVELLRRGIQTERDSALLCELLTMFAGWPGAADTMFNCAGYVEFIISEIPDDWAVRCCARLAKITTRKRDELINCGAIFQLLDHSLAVSPVRFSTVCRLGIALLAHEVHEQHVDIVREFLTYVIGAEKTMDVGEPKFMKLGTRAIVNGFEIVENQFYVFLESMNRLLGSDRSVQWDARCCELMMAGMRQKSSALEERVIQYCWTVAITMMRNDMDWPSRVVMCMVDANPGILCGQLELMRSLLDVAPYYVKCRIFTSLAVMFCHNPSIVEEAWETFVHLMDADVSSDAFRTVVKSVLTCLTWSNQSPGSSFRVNLRNHEGFKVWIAAVTPETTIAASPDTISECQMLRRAANALFAENA